MIYAVQASNGLIKFGYTTNLRTRLGALRWIHRDALKPLGYVPEASILQEFKLHRLLRGSRANKEWFEPTELVMRVVGMMRPWPPMAPFQPSRKFPYRKNVDGRSFREADDFMPKSEAAE